MPKTHKEIFVRVMHERDKFELLLNRVGYAPHDVEGRFRKWSIKDMLAHILAYEQYIADRMHEILHGEEYVPAGHRTHWMPFSMNLDIPILARPAR